MEQNNLEKNQVVFRLMVTSVDTLAQQIERYNTFFGTDFEIIDITEEEVPFCDIKASQYKLSDIFGLGFSLAIFEQKLREEGEIDW